MRVAARCGQNVLGICFFVRVVDACDCFFCDHYLYIFSISVQLGVYWVQFMQFSVGG